MRSTIRKAAPGAKEAIKYQIPTFMLNGNLIHFAAYKAHVGLYPTPKGVAAFKDELSVYGSGKGSARFPLDEPMPFALITKIVKFRVKQTSPSARPKAKRRTRVAQTLVTPALRYTGHSPVLPRLTRRPPTKPATNPVTPRRLRA